jgi:hypothetical protein
MFFSCINAPPALIDNFFTIPETGITVNSEVAKRKAKTVRPYRHL